MYPKNKKPCDFFIKPKLPEWELPKVTHTPSGLFRPKPTKVKTANSERVSRKQDNGVS